MVDLEGNFDEFIRQVDAAIVHLDAQLDEAYFNWSIKIFIDLVEHTPQWSGDLAANWNFDVHSPSGGYHRLPYKTLAWPPNDENPPFQRGAPLATGAAVYRAIEQARPRWKDTIYFTNNTPIADDVENHRVNIRPVNLLEDQVAMASFMAFKWTNMPYDATRYSFP